MKRPFAPLIWISFFLILFVSVSCQKDTVRSTAGCAACAARVQSRPVTVRVIVDQWILVNPGKYNSNLYAAIKKYSNGITNISNITVLVDDGGNDKPIWRGTPINFSAGSLLWRGETLFYTVDPQTIQNNQPAIQHLILTVTIL
ncbi:MAG: hypothetical protein ACHQET_03380 [Chitinophagales bacterium]